MLFSNLPIGGGVGDPTSNLACLGAAASYAAGYVYVRRFLSGTGTSPMGAATSQLIAATVIQAVLTPAIGWHLGAVTPAVVGAVAALGLLGTGYATVLYFHLIRDLGAGLASSVDYLVPVFAVFFGVVFGGEHLTLALAAGAALILVGMAVAEGHLTHSLTRLQGRATSTSTPTTASTTSAASTTSTAIHATTRPSRSHS